ncbi:hypothetical protein EVAR_91741_1, partial [Eumeta japonica]
MSVSKKKTADYTSLEYDTFFPKRVFLTKHQSGSTLAAGPCDPRPVREANARANTI